MCTGDIHKHCILHTHAFLHLDLMHSNQYLREPRYKSRSRIASNTSFPLSYNTTNCVQVADRSSLPKYPSLPFTQTLRVHQILSLRRVKLTTGIHNGMELLLIRQDQRQTKSRYKSNEQGSACNCFESDIIPFKTPIQIILRCTQTLHIRIQLPVV